MSNRSLRSRNDHTLNSAQIAIEGWDFPEAAYVASLGHLQDIRLPHISAKAGYIRSSGCHNLFSPLARIFHGFRGYLGDSWLISSRNHNDVDEKSRYTCRHTLEWSD